MTFSKGKMQGFQRLLEDQASFAMVQLDSDKMLLFSGDFSGSRQGDFSKAQLFAPDFFREDEKSWWQFSEICWLPIKELEDWASEVRVPAPILDWDEPSFLDFSSQATAIQQGFSQHRLHKAVPTVFAKAPLPDGPPVAWWLSRALRNRNASQLYLLRLPNEGVVGLTPETLFEFRCGEGRVQSMALAGTRASEQEADQPLLSDPKELHEHNLVLSEVKQRLASFGKVRHAPTKTWNLGKLTHLRTDIELELAENLDESKLFIDLERALHPTPALGVASESLSFKWLKDLPGARQRFRFGAPFGFWLPGWGARVLVAIRNLQWGEKDCLLGVGCGYVPQSDVNREWKELSLKRAAVRARFEV